MLSWRFLCFIMGLKWRVKTWGQILIHFLLLSELFKFSSNLVLRGITLAFTFLMKKSLYVRLRLNSRLRSRYHVYVGGLPFKPFEVIQGSLKFAICPEA